MLSILGKQPTLLLHFSSISLGFLYEESLFHMQKYMESFVHVCMIFFVEIIYYLIITLAIIKFLPHSTDRL